MNKKKAPSGLSTSEDATGLKSSSASTKETLNPRSDVARPGTPYGFNTSTVPRRVTWNYENVMTHVSNRVGRNALVRLDSSQYGVRLSVARPGHRDAHPQEVAHYRYSSGWHEDIAKVLSHFEETW